MADATQTPYNASTAAPPPAVHTQPGANVPMSHTQAATGDPHVHGNGNGYAQDEKTGRQFVNQSNTWAHSLFACFDEPLQCLTGYCCPCIVYGRKQHRLSHPDDTQVDVCNGDCIAYAALGYCGIAFLLGFIGRQKERDQFGIEGSAAGDCLTSFFCGCCALIQEEKEIDARYGRAVNY